MSVKRVNMKLRAARKAKKWSCKKAAEMIGISKAHYYKIENYKEHQDVRIDLAKRIANVFDMNFAELFSDDAYFF